MGCAETKESPLVAPKLQRLDSLAENRSAMDDFLQQEEQLDLESRKMLHDLMEEDFEKNFGNVMLQGEDRILLYESGRFVRKDQVRKQMVAKFLFKDFEKNVKLAKEKVMEKTKEDQKSNVAKLWDEFDKDGNGVLSQEENRNLVKTYLETTRKNYPAILKFHCEIELAKVCDVTYLTTKTKLLEHQGEGFDWMVDRVETMVKNRVKAMQDAELKKLDSKLAKLQEKADAELQKILIKHEKIADELLVKMDLDHDGQVVRKEFESCFCELILQVFDTDQIIETMRKEMKATQEEFPQTIDNMLEQIMGKLEAAKEAKARKDKVLVVTVYASQEGEEVVVKCVNMAGEELAILRMNLSDHVADIPTKLTAACDACTGYKLNFLCSNGEALDTAGAESQMLLSKLLDEDPANG